MGICTRHFLTICLWLPLLVCLGRMSVVAEEPTLAAKSQELPAEDYRQLLAEVRSRKTISMDDIESLANRSRCIMYIEAAADHVMNRDVLVRVTHKHVQRMQAIQALVDQRVKVDGATKEALAAARYHCKFAEIHLAVLRVEGERELSIVFPESNAAMPKVSRPRELFVYVDENGHYRACGKRVSFDDLREILIGTWVNNPGRAVVVIKADARTNFTAVTAAMDACREAKIKDVRVTLWQRDNSKAPAESKETKLSD